MGAVTMPKRMTMPGDHVAMRLRFGRLRCTEPSPAVQPLRLPRPNVRQPHLHIDPSLIGRQLLSLTDEGLLEPAVALVLQGVLDRAPLSDRVDHAVGFLHPVDVVLDVEVDATMRRVVALALHSGRPFSSVSCSTRLTTLTT